MRHYHLKDMKQGWFVGSFAPTALDTKHCEVAVKQYTAGQREAAHHHKIATELTAIVTGSVSMFGRDWTAGDIVLIEPEDTTDFIALTDVVTVVVKLPSVPNDKYIESSKNEQNPEAAV
jgi:anti-sigma factor ChrR (cupin superfamily)